jgi:ketosteroid isomerase-like protein
VSARRDLVERFYASFDAADVDAARECFAPDVADAALATWREFTERVKGAAPDARLQVVSAIEEGDRIAVEGTLTGTFTAPMRTPKGEAPPSGNAFSLAFADVFHHHGGPHRAAHRVLRSGGVPHPARAAAGLIRRRRVGPGRRVSQLTTVCVVKCEHPLGPRPSSPRGPGPPSFVAAVHALDAPTPHAPSAARAPNATPP